MVPAVPLNPKTPLGGEMVVVLEFIAALFSALYCMSIL